MGRLIAILCNPTLTTDAPCQTIAGGQQERSPVMPHAPQQTTAVHLPQRRDRSRWLVPAAIGVLGLITLTLILFALGVLVGLIRF